MISQAAEYSLRAVVYLAANPGVPLTTHQIAQAAHVPEGYLAKVLQTLSRAGMVASQRGINGGFVLTREPENLTLMDVIQVADPSRRIMTCPLGLKEHGINLCSLHRQVDQAVAAAERVLRGTTVAQVLGDQCNNRPLCGHEVTVAGKL